MIVEPVLVTQSVLVGGFNSFVTNSAALSEIFSGSGRSQTEISDIVTHFTESIPSVGFGYPKLVPQAGLGAVFVSLGTDKEIQNEQFIGSEGPTTSSTGLVDIGTPVRSVVRISIIATNYVYVGYLSILVKWILLNNRFNLEQNFGLMEQVIGMNDVVPAPPFLQDLPFRRDIMLEVTKIDFIDDSDVLNKLLQITVEPEASKDTSFSFTVT